MNRRIMDLNRNNYINLLNLNLNQYKDEIQQLISLNSGEDKLYYMITYLENNLQIVDIFSNFFFTESNYELNDLSKYYLLNILAILDSNIMKTFFPKTDIKHSNLIISKEHPLTLSKKFFKILFTILCRVKVSEITVTVGHLMMNYSNLCDDFIDYCLDDIRYINKIYNLSYNNSKEILYDVITILDNIISHSHCSPEHLENILQNAPIILRLKEIICTNLDLDLKINILLILETLANNIQEDFYNSYFSDFINYFYNEMALNPYNIKIFKLILNILNVISNEESICELINSTGLSYKLLDILSKPNEEDEIILYILEIFSNIFYFNNALAYIFNNHSKKLKEAFIQLINTYKNSAKERDYKIIESIIFCISNLAAGPPEVQNFLSKTDIPEYIIEILKIKERNNIYFEGVHFFNNIIDNCDKETFAIISELHPFKIFAKGLEKTGDLKNIELCLNAIKNLISKNMETYGSNQNLKMEFYTCLAKRTIDNLTLSKNENIANLAESISFALDDKMKYD